MLDSVDAEDPAGDAVEVVGVVGDDMDEEVGDAAESVHFDDLRNSVECLCDLRQLALSDAGEDEGGQRVAEGGENLRAIESTAGLVGILFTSDRGEVAAVSRMLKFCGRYCGSVCLCSTLVRDLHRDTA